MTKYVVAFDSTSTGAGAGCVPLPADSSLPSGLIVMWSGLLSAIPTGWLLCDGTNGTPDLLAKFIKGVATSATDPGATGGAASQSYTPAGSNSAPSFTGASNQATSSVSAGTPAGTNSVPAFSGTPATLTHAGSAVADHAAHTHSVTSNVAVADHAAHTHSIATGSGSFKGTSAGGFSTVGGAAPGVSGATGNPSATLTHSVTNNAVTSGNPSATLSHVVTQPNDHSYTPAGSVAAATFTGSALGTHSHTLTPAGTVGAPTFSGTPASIPTEPAYFALAYIMKS